MKKNSMSEEQKYLIWLKKEIKSLNKSRKHYAIQSEWHRLMYPKLLELEMLEKFLNK